MAKLSGGLLFLGGHVTNPETARLLARDTEMSATGGGRGGRVDGTALANRNWRAPVELSMMAAVFGGAFACVALGALVLAGVLPQ